VDAIWLCYTFGTMKTLPGLLLALACASVSSLATAQPGTHWLEVKTPHFTVMSNAGEKDARHVAVQFERMRAVFHTLMPSASDDPAAPIIVLALKDKKAFRTLEPAEYLAKNQLDLAGLFVRAQDKNYVLVRLDSEDENPFSTVYHEYTHYMFRRYEEWMPLWLNEGFAEFYQNTNIADKDIRVGKPSFNDILYMRQNKLLPIQTILTVDHSSPYYHDEQKGSVFYAESWALTHYLQVMDYDNHTTHMLDYLKLMQQHKDSVAAAQEAFGDLGKLQKALDNYISGGQFKEFKLNAPVAFTEASFEVRPVPDTEADAVRAGVLLNVQRAKEAEDLLTAVMQADPKNALAHETMGELKFREHDIPAAKKWFGEAVQLDSKSYLAQYYFAAMSLQDGGSGEDIEKSLKTSIELNPRFAASYDALAHYYVVRHEKLDEAHMANVHAIQLEPENLQYRMNAASVLAENQNLTGAIGILKAALPLAKQDGEKQMVTDRIASMESYLESVKQAQERGAMPPNGSIPSSMPAGGSRVIVIDDGKKEPEYPSGPPGAKHTVSGVLRGVKCSYPSIITMNVDNAGKQVALYANNFYKIEFTTLNYEPKEDILPCTGIEGMKAKVVYGEVKDERVAGQIVAIELSK
jgi:tetratricopeptide (TPR) repeat protein